MEKARAIALQVLRDVAPEEERLAIDILEPLIEGALAGDPLTLDRSDEAGRFGVGDWDTFLVVPLIVDALQRRQRGESVSLTAEDVRALAKRLGTRRSRRDAAVLAASITAALSALPAMETSSGS
jgi:hypothetical protein